MSCKNFIIFYTFVVFHATAAGQQLASIQGVQAEGINRPLTTPLFEYHLKWAYIQLQDELGRVVESEVRNHYLGREVAVRMHIFEKEYAIRTEQVPGSFSEKIVYRKPVIYHSIYKMNRYYRSLVKRKNIQPEIASNDMSKFIELAILLLNEHTKDLEKELLRAENPSMIVEVFRRIVIIG